MTQKCRNSDRHRGFLAVVKVVESGTCSVVERVQIGDFLRPKLNVEASKVGMGH